MILLVACGRHDDAALGRWLDVGSADGAVGVRVEPALDAGRVEEVGAEVEPPQLLPFLQRRQAHWAFAATFRLRTCDDDRRQLLLIWVAVGGAWKLLIVGGWGWWALEDEDEGVDYKGDDDYEEEHKDED